MNKTIALIALLLIVCALLCACGAREEPPAARVGPEEPPVDGGVTNVIDTNAPKTISSTEIVSFDCSFSTLVLSDPGSLGNSLYTLHAERKDGAAIGSYSNRDGLGSMSFAVDASFMDELQQLVASYDLAQYNGSSHSVSGLPDMFGSSINVEYASGEKIIAYDNQSGFLPLAAMNDLDELFLRAASPVPEPIPVSLAKEYGNDYASNHQMHTSIVFPTLGFTDIEGECTLPEGSEAMQLVIEEYMDRLRREAAESLEDQRAEAEASSADSGMFYSERRTQIERCDSVVVSFFEESEAFESDAWTGTLRQKRGHTYSAPTGRELRFADVFRDLDGLAEAVCAGLRAQYPDVSFDSDLEATIRDSVRGVSSSLSFTLSYGRATFCINGIDVCDRFEPLQVSLAFDDHPGLVKGCFLAAPESYMLPLQYDDSYSFPDTPGFRMTCDVDEDLLTAYWTLESAGQTAEENYYSEKPSCWFVRAGGRSLVYVNVPAGDVSMVCDIFELTESGPKLLDEVRMALEYDTCLDPQRMTMALNDYVVCDFIMLIPYGFYRVGEDGLPEHVGDTWGLYGPEVAMREFARVNPRSREDAAVSGGMWTLGKGKRLRPLATDLNSYIEFITNDGRICRFEIDGFTDRMQLDNFGGLTDIFEMPGEDR